MSKPFHGIRAVTFDFDGTLADTCDILLQSRLAALEALEITAPEPDFIMPLLGMNPRQSFELCGDIPNERLLDELTDIYNTVLTERSLPGPRYNTGAVETLRALRARGIKTAVVSLRRDADLRRVARAWGLDLLTDFIQGDDVAGAERPAPDALLLAADALATDPAQLLHVGDTVFDIEMARNAGAAAVAYTGGAHTRRVLAASSPDLLADTLADIPSML